jgi:uncharacterized protein YegL
MLSASSLNRKSASNIISSAHVNQEAEVVLVANLNASATALAACQGIDPANLNVTEATIVVFVVDASGSMQGVTNEVRESLQESVAAMADSKSSAALILTQLVFDEYVRVAFANQPVENIKPTDITYTTGGSTALYDAVLDALTGALTYEEQMLQTGVTPKVILCVFSDGANNASRRATAQKIFTVMSREIKQRENWTVAFVGFATYESASVDYHQVARDMGIDTVLVIDLAGDVYQRQHGIRQTFRLVSKSVIKRSQTTVNPNAPSVDFFAVA